MYVCAARDTGRAESASRQQVRVEGTLDMNVMKRTVTMMTVLAGAAVLAGCTQEASRSAASRLPVYAADVTGGAKVCETPNVNPAAGQTIDLSIRAGNGGGWCGISVHQDGPKPFDAGLLTSRPQHGSVTIHSVGDNTRIDYVPDVGYAGPDAYGVTLLPGSSVLKVTVTVVKG